MKTWVLSHLRCPKCLSCLEETTFEANDGGEPWSGVLVCGSGNCRAWYPIIRGIPRMLSESLIAPLREPFTREHGAALNKMGLVARTSDSLVGDLHELKQQTIRNFGFEWTEYARFGWDDPVYNLAQEEQVFLRKSLLEPEDVGGKLVLDAGCGNGRYSYWAAKYGGRVIAVDLGDGVESAGHNTRDIPNIQVVQGDIFNLPFAAGCFDVVFSIGVLMHTGDAARAATALAGKLRPGGSLSVHLYGKGNFVYELVDSALRRRTIRMSTAELEEFTRRAYRFRRVLEKMRLTSWLINRFVRLDSHPHCIFDWYAAPIATHHTYGEVKEWFRTLDLKIVGTNERHLSKSFMKRALHPVCGSGSSTVTIRGVSAIKERCPAVVPV